MAAAGYPHHNEQRSESPAITYHHLFSLFLFGIASGESSQATKIPLTKTIPKQLIACVSLNNNMPSVSKVVIIANVMASSEVSGVPCGLLKNSV
jgi:hypothetical protein